MTEELRQRMQAEPWYIPMDGHTLAAIEKFVLSEIAQAESRGAAEERQFVLNILDGIDIANSEMGLPHDTKAIRFALASRALPTTPKE